MKQHKTPTLQFSKIPTCLNHISSMDTKVPLKLAPYRKHCFLKNVDHLSNYAVTALTPKVMLILFDFNIPPLVIKVWSKNLLNLMIMLSL